MGAKLYVGNLPSQVTEQSPRDLFSRAGGVESIKIVTNYYTGQARGLKCQRRYTTITGSK